MRSLFNNAAGKRLPTQKVQLVNSENQSVRKTGGVEPHPALKGLTTDDDTMPRIQTILDISLKHTHCIHGITVHKFQSTKR